MLHTRISIICIVILMCLIPLLSQAQDNGTISGIVRDNKNETLPGVTIRVENTQSGTVTQVDGSYNLAVPAGTYSVSFSYVGYDTKKVTSVKVTRNKITGLDMVIEPNKASSLNEVVVTASFKQASVEGLYSKQKNSSSVSDGISADQIRKTPDNNAAQVLKRVNGLTIQDNKFVTVRGMSERYNNVMLNNSMLPSTEPNRRNFSFDIIPSNLIDNIVVMKTATPDLPGEFAGGVVLVQTKGVPDKDYITVAAGTGYNTLSIGQPFHSLKRAPSEYFGKPGGTRDWWYKKWDDREYKNILAQKDFGKVAEYDKKIPNTWGLYRYKYNPLQQYQLAVGRLLRLKNNASLGATVAVTYRHDEQLTEEAQRFRISHYILRGNAYDINNTIAGIANFGYQNKNTKISFKNLYNKRFTHTTQEVSGTALSGGGAISSYTDIITVNDMYQNRLEGDHVVTSKKIKLNWSLDRSQLVRLQPDMRNSTTVNGNYGLTEAQGSFSITSPGLSIMNARLKESRLNYAINVTLPFTLLKQEQKIKVGYLGYQRDADFLFSGLKLSQTPGSNLSDDLYGRPDYFVADPKFLTATGMYYKPAGPSFSNTPEAYTGKQTQNSGYIMADVKPIEKLRLIGGVRVEANGMEVNTINYAFNAQGIPITKDSVIEFRKTDVLPSVNAVYSLTQKMNIRAAYSQTVARPDFRERSAFQYYDFYDNTTYKGIAGLKDTKTENIDIRFEYYPKSGEIFSVSAFYKKFTDPVELIQQQSSGDEAVNLYFNLQSSTNYGIEADFRKSLGFLSGNRSILRSMYLNGNFTYMQSSVEYDINRLTAEVSGLNPKSFDNADANRKRPLQGLSPYIINGAIGYEAERLGAQVSYNRIGPRLIVGGPHDYEDQFENARDVVDFQISTKAWHNKLDIRLNVSDLLQQPYIIYQNAGVSADKTQIIDQNNDPKKNNYNKNLDVVRLKTYKGSNISLSLSLQL
jgi:TonB-dependent receptor